MQVNLTKTQKIKLLNSKDIYKVMQQVLLREHKIDRSKEHFWTIGLDHSSQVLYIELISLGSSRSVPVEPMQVFRVGVMKAAVTIILVHNHPGGSLQPSMADKDITDRLIQVGKILDIPVLDHLIINEKNYHSFLTTGLLDQLEESSRYVPNYKKQEQMKKAAEELGEKKGEDRKTKEFARQLKAEGFSIEKIAYLTGITEAEAKKLKVQKPKKK